MAQENHQSPITPPMPPTPPEVPSTPKSVNIDPADKQSLLPQRTMMLIGILAFVTVTLILVAVKLQHSHSMILLPTPTPKISMAHTTLTLMQETATPSSIDVIINTTSNKASAVQIELAYDPMVITNVSVKQGVFFPQATPLLNIVDTKNGRVSYAVAIPINGDGIGGTGTVATINYQKISGVTKDIIFTFLPKTKVTQLGILDSILEKTTNLTIPVKTKISPL
jgi:hypothetical protein